MNPSRYLPSVTVAAIIARVARRPHEYLLVEEETPEGLRLNNPAGHLDPGESPSSGVVREALEETARAFTPEALLGVYLSRVRRPSRGEDVTYVRLAFAGTVGDRTRPRARPRHRAHAVDDARRAAREPRRDTAARWYCAASRTTRAAGASRSSW